MHFVSKYKRRERTCSLGSKWSPFGIMAPTCQPTRRAMNSGLALQPRILGLLLQSLPAHKGREARPNQATSLASSYPPNRTQHCAPLLIRPLQWRPPAHSRSLRPPPPPDTRRFPTTSSLHLRAVPKPSTSRSLFSLPGPLARGSCFGFN